MSLLVLVTPKLPRDENQTPYLTGYFPFLFSISISLLFFLPTSPHPLSPTGDTIRSFINLHWQHACERVGKSLEFDEDFQSMMSALNRKRVPLIQLGAQKKREGISEESSSSSSSSKK